MTWRLGKGYRTFVQTMKSGLLGYGETTYFVGAVQIHARELPIIQQVFTEMELRDHVKIEGVMSTQGDMLIQIGFFAYDRHDAKKILSFLDSVAERMRKRGK